MLSNGDYQAITYFEMPSEWIYRGEGNCNVVISLPKSRKILRIKKTDRPKTIIGWLFIWITDFLSWYSGKGINEELRDLSFYSMIMRPLISRRYTSEGNQVHLSRKQIKILEEDLSKVRPDFRKNKVLQYGRATLFDDFAFLPQEEYDYLPFLLSDSTFAVEIKPKQGWQAIREKNIKCLFCMNQYLKAENNKIKEISNFCPEDLFSGNKARICKGITALIKNPQNNFRIFKNGSYLYGENSKSNFEEIVQQIFESKNEKLDSLQEEFCDLLGKCLLTDLNNVDSTEICKDKLFCKWNKIIQESKYNGGLPKGCVLDKILSVQMLDTEGVNYYIKLLKSKDYQNWDYVNMLLDKIGNGIGCLKCSIMMLNNSADLKDESDLIFVPYLISAIAKDCSLMITLKKIKDEHCGELDMKNVIQTKYGYFLMNVGVFDLYPKPLSTIKKHFKRSKNILQAYTRASTKIF